MQPELAYWTFCLVVPAPIAAPGQPAFTLQWRVACIPATVAPEQYASENGFIDQIKYVRPATEQERNVRYETSDAPANRKN